MDPLLSLILLIAFIAFVYMKYRTPSGTNEVVHTSIINDSHKFPVKSVQNPFIIEIDASKTSLTNGVYFKLDFCQEFKDVCHFVVAWSVNIQKFYENLDKNFIEKFHETNFLVDNSMIISKNELVDASLLPKQSCHILTPDEVKQAHMISTHGVVQNYPLVIALYRTRDKLMNLQEIDIVATVCVIHLKDSKTDTKVLFNYSKCFNDKVINIKKLYTQESENCIVCLSEASTQVLLPCKHLCVCKTCYNRLDSKCPLCRKPIVKTFEIIS